LAQLYKDHEKNAKAKKEYMELKALGASQILKN
jgi:hypothetical protein